MEVQIINQVPGKHSFLSELKNELRREYHTLKVLVAYLSWDGLKTIYKELEHFYDEGRSIKMIVGLGTNAREIHVLRYLKERMPDGDYKVFNAANLNYTFHPKLFYFEHDESLTVYVGSSNLSYGGLYSNSECILKIKLNRQLDKELIIDFEDVWSTYSKPEEPFSKKNLLNIDNTLLNNINRKHTDKNEHIEISDDVLISIKRLFSTISFPELHVSDMPSETKSPKPELVTKQTLIRNESTLYLEILIETGAGGTQVQIPTEVVKNYFGMIQTEKYKTIEISISKNQYRPAVISSFDNFTYRISINELSDISRPLLLRFERLAPDKYLIDLIIGIQYEKKIKECTNRTRSDSKRWLIK